MPETDMVDSRWQRRRIEDYAARYRAKTRQGERSCRVYMRGDSLPIGCAGAGQPVRRILR
jgi:hypothetical protein